MENPHAWIDSLPEDGLRSLRRLIIELTVHAQRTTEGMQWWAQTQWSSQQVPRNIAVDLVEFAERSEEGKALVAAWRSTVEIHADPELHAELTAPLDGDFGPVPEPGSDTAQLVARLREAQHIPGLTDAVWRWLEDQALLDDPALQESLAQLRRGEGVPLAEFLATVEPEQPERPRD